ncbi:UPF0736 protein [Halolactibacillus alkaliphilus]|uniref:UPF0736 protein n=1 Tax=Halolactibacillus alkaliphilus TaxID=442899 RepID=A0A511X1I4_9BACI|nr:DUF3603 family protein [Halolactibacillus alkaliphilus]GEN56808.1 UPF0736 protein [Halolactibacillus alkaliphilus]GGN71086.1 UPF0736 protein [Halolactibacillus alkaliphilus]SFO80995.1 Protein of unknown function [Halolactibacillus alkaliphilus]
MSCIHHVKVNWFETETETLSICPFYEWRKRDFIDTYQTVPILCLEKETFSMIESTLSGLPQTFFLKMHQKSMKHHHRYDYCAVLTDKQSILAIDTLGYDFPLLKSRLTPIKEQQVLKISETLPICDGELKVVKPKHTPYTLTNQQLIGLTRQERELKYLLMSMFEQLEKNKQYQAIDYFMTVYYRLINRPVERGYQIFLKTIACGFTKAHHELIKNMLPLDACYQELYFEAITDETIENYMHY